jgi:hypothetical protein
MLSNAIRPVAVAITVLRVTAERAAQGVRKGRRNEQDQDQETTIQTSNHDGFRTRQSCIQPVVLTNQLEFQLRYPYEQYMHCNSTRILY